MARSVVNLMNCSQQTTNGAHVAATNMTTLLQKNRIKTLQMNNGSVVVVGTTPVSNLPMTQQAQVFIIHHYYLSSLMRLAMDVFKCFGSF